MTIIKFSNFFSRAFYWKLGHLSGFDLYRFYSFFFSPVLCFLSNFPFNVENYGLPADVFFFCPNEGKNTKKMVDEKKRSHFMW